MHIHDYSSIRSVTGAVGINCRFSYASCASVVSFYLNPGLSPILFPFKITTRSASPPRGNLVDGLPRAASVHLDRFFDIIVIINRSYEPKSGRIIIHFI